MSLQKNALLRTLLLGTACQLLLLSPAQAQTVDNSRLSTHQSCREIRKRVIDIVVNQAYSHAPYRRHHPRNHLKRQPRKRTTQMPLGLVDDGATMGAPNDLSRSSGFGSVATRATASFEKTESKMALADSAGPTNFTGTNTQEAGVDEADIVETDGRFIYTVQNGELLILKSWPANQTSILSRLRLASHISPVQMLLKDNTLVLLAQVNQTLSSYRQPRLPNRHLADTRGRLLATRIILVNVTDRTAPVLSDKFDVEGQMVQARLIAEDLYLVTRGQLHIPPTLRKTAYSIAQKRPRNRRQMRANVDDAFGSREMANAMPRTRQGWGRQKMKGLKSIYGCNNIYLAEASGLAVLNMSHLNVIHPTKVHSIGLQSTSKHVYASQQALYVAAQMTGNNRGTPIHKFSLRRDNKAPQYVASGSVPGYLLNQFAMSEHKGDLRVATTTNAQAGNNLFVLRQSGKKLNQIGAVTGLAKSERIYAVRMFGDRGYVVTFRRTDPLYTLDLSEPQNPRVVGELKIPGFSSYIHPLDQDHLLTIGQDADQNGRVRGLHLQIFDVSDMAKPRRTVQKLVNPNGSSSSAAQHNHLAFTFDGYSRTLAIPVQFRGQQNFVGLALYQVGEKEVKELGRISHQPLLADFQRRLRNFRRINHSSAAPQISRSIIMDEFVYTLSHIGLQVNRLHDPQQVEAGVLFTRSGTG